MRHGRWGTAGSLGWGLQPWDPLPGTSTGHPESWSLGRSWGGPAPGPASVPGSRWVNPLLVLPTELTGTVGETTAQAAVGRGVTLQTCPAGNNSLPRGRQAGLAFTGDTISSQASSKEWKCLTKLFLLWTPSCQGGWGKKSQSKMDVASGCAFSTWLKALMTEPVLAAQPMCSRHRLLLYPLSAEIVGKSCVAFGSSESCGAEECVQFLPALLSARWLHSPLLIVRAPTVCPARQPCWGLCACLTWAGKVGGAGSCPASGKGPCKLLHCPLL